MTTLLPTLVATCFAAVVGYLTPLVWTERPLWGLFRDVTNANVKDMDTRRIYSAVHVVTAKSATIPRIFAASGTVLAVFQAWQGGSDRPWAAVLCATLAVVYILCALYYNLETGKRTDPTDDINKVRAAIRRQMTFHYMAITMLTVILLVQLVFVIGW